MTRRWGRVGTLRGPWLGIVLGVTVGISAGIWQLSQFVPGAQGAGSFDGADGIHLADANGDGRLDAVSGAEQGLRVAAAFNPGPIDGAVWGEWPYVLLPDGVNMCSVEDAIWCDVDIDGALDIIAACETGPQRVEIEFAPAPPNSLGELINPANWTRVTLDASANLRSMRAVCADLAGDAAVELLIGGKDAGVAASLGYYSSATPRVGSSWTYTSIIAVGWIMDLHLVDIENPPDGDLDIIVSDKDGISDPVPDGSHAALKVMINNGLDPPSFTEQFISANEAGWKWFDPVDWDEDGDYDVVACRSQLDTFHEQTIWINGGGGAWSEIPIPIPPGTGICQETTAIDWDLDGDLDVGTSYSNAGGLSGVTISTRTGTALSPGFVSSDIAGVLDADSDVKMDNIAWADLDEDGDPDAITTEQHVATGLGPGLGMIGLQNPTIAFQPSIAPPAVACNDLTSGTTIVSSTTAVSDVITPAANAVVYAGYLSAVGSTQAPTGVTGNGLTWVQVATQVFHTSSARRITVFRAMGASPTTGAVTATWAASQTSKQWAIIECSGVDTSGTDGSGATVQSVATSSTGTTTLTNTLAALAAPTSVHLAFVGHVGNNGTSPDDDFTELTDTAVSTGIGNFEVEWATGEVSVTPTWSSTFNAAAISIEVRIAP